MFDVSLIQPISQVAAAIGVCVAAIYYVINLRNAEKAKTRDMILLRLRPMDQYHTDAWATVAKMVDWETPEELGEKYNLVTNQDAFRKLSYIIVQYNLAGLLLQKKLIRPEDFFQIYSPNWCVIFYERFEGFIKSNRVLPSGEECFPDFSKGFEALYLEAVRRYPNAKGRVREVVDAEIRRHVGYSPQASQ